MTAKKISAKLADGRDLFYFDDAGSQLSAERKADARNLDARPAVAQMRLDALSGDWISVAASRHGRAFLPPASECPLCPSTDTFLSEVPDRFDVAVFENKNPSFGPDLASIDDKNYWVEPKEEIADRVRRCLKHAPAERLGFAPDCGLSQTARWASRAKLENMVAGVAIVRRELGLS